jgi:hypothetical protein
MKTIIKFCTFDEVPMIHLGIPTRVVTDGDEYLRLHYSFYPESIKDATIGDEYLRLHYSFCPGTPQRQYLDFPNFLRPLTEMKLCGDDRTF